MSASSTDAHADPIVALIRQQMLRRGLDRRQLGHLLSTGRNPSKTFRRLDQLLRGERVVSGFVQQVAEALQIPAEQLAVAREAHDAQERKRHAECRRRAMEDAMERRGQHLWGILPVNYLPSLITVLGAEFYLLVRVPEEVLELPDFEQMKEVGKLAGIHYREQRRCRLAGYDFRRSLHEVFRFGVDGESLGRADGPFSEPRTFVRVGGREAEKLFFAHDQFCGSEETSSLGT